MAVRGSCLKIAAWNAVLWNQIRNWKPIRAERAWALITVTRTRQQSWKYMYKENFSAGFITMLTSPMQITDLSQSCHCRLHPFCSCQTPSQMACDATWALGLKAIYMFTTQPRSWCWHSNYTSVGLPSSFTLPWLYWVWRSCKPTFPVTVAMFIFDYGFCKGTIRYHERAQRAQHGR